MVLKIDLLLLPTPNAPEVNTSGDPIAEVSGTIPVINHGGRVFVFFLSLLGNLSIIGMLKSSHLYYLRLGLRVHHLGGLYQ